MPMAFALKIEVPWNDTNRKHRLCLALVDQDGRPVRVQTPMGEQDVEIRSEFEVGRPAGVTLGTPMDLALAINLALCRSLQAAADVLKCLINEGSLRPR